MIFVDVHVIGGITLENVLQRVATDLHHTIMRCAIDALIAAEGGCVKHVIGHHRSSVAFLGIVAIREGVVEVHREVLQRCDFRSHIGTHIGGGETLAIAVLMSVTAERNGFP